MAGFFKNRHTALILALASVLIASPMIWTPVSAGSFGSSGGSPGSDNPGDIGDGKGDPDVPTAPARVAIGHPAARKITTVAPEAQTVGEVRVPAGVWVWRLRIVLQSLKAYTFRF